jgi:putative membrane protein
MPSPMTSVLHAARGAAIGLSEVVPGISGGTVALIVGVYERLITSAGHLVGAARLLLTDREAARRELARVRWDVVVPVLLGIVPAVLVGARVLGPLVEDHPVPTLALFLGMSLAAITVPAGMVGPAWTWPRAGLAALVAVVVFLVVGIPPQQVPTHLVLVFLAAAVAVCALVLPGLSGSFLLLTLGLYTPTITALNEGRWAYIAVFVAGMVVGLSMFVRILQHLLEEHHVATLVVVTGIIAGAVRALWPWQEEDRTLLPPAGDLTLPTALFLLGVAVVLGLAWLGRRGEEHQHAVQDAEHTAEVEHAHGGTGAR